MFFSVSAPASVSVSEAGFQKESVNCKGDRKDKLANEVKETDDNETNEKTYSRSLIGGAKRLKSKMYLILHWLARQFLD